MSNNMLLGKDFNKVHVGFFIFQKDTVMYIIGESPCYTPETNTVCQLRFKLYQLIESTNIN